MEIMSIDKDGYNDCLKIAASFLQKGRLVCFPTETFYALGVKYDDEIALKRLVELKKRPGSRAFSLMIGDRESIGRLVHEVEFLEEELINAFWPGPLTMVFRAREGLSRLVTDDNGTVAVRMPGRSFALDLALLTDIPITATSANISGDPAARSVDEVLASLGSGIDLIVDGGTSVSEFPSTIVDARDDEITVLREGAIKRAEIMSVIKKRD